jgi:hypothetical protein
MLKDESNGSAGQVIHRNFIKQPRTVEQYINGLTRDDFVRVIINVKMRLHDAPEERIMREVADELHRKFVYNLIARKVEQYKINIENL